MKREASWTLKQVKHLKLWKLGRLLTSFPMISESIAQLTINYFSNNQKSRTVNIKMLDTIVTITLRLIA